MGDIPYYFGILIFAIIIFSLWINIK